MLILQKIQKVVAGKIGAAALLLTLLPFCVFRVPWECVMTSAALAFNMTEPEQSVGAENSQRSFHSSSDGSSSSAGTVAPSEVSRASSKMEGKPAAVMVMQRSVEKQSDPAL